MTQQERFEFIESEIDRAFVHADDEWKQEYYQNAAKYLAEHKKLLRFRRKDLRVLQVAGDG